VIEVIGMVESKILIIDDDVGICETLADIFQKKGYRVVTAGTSSEAIDRAGQTAFDVALIDISLPDMQGIDLLASLKEIEPDLVVIMITADASMKNIVRALNEGASTYIAEEYEKPIQLIITDVVMPGMNGRELAERIQSIRPEIRVIYMSGYTDNAISHHGVLEPGINFIEKPFTPIGLMRKIREVLDSCPNSPY
jgi:DNA-binding NtrC family response regulator